MAYLLTRTIQLVALVIDFNFIEDYQMIGMNILGFLMLMARYRGQTSCDITAQRDSVKNDLASTVSSLSLR